MLSLSIYRKSSPSRQQNHRALRKASLTESASMSHEPLSVKTLNLSILLGI